MPYYEDTITEWSQDMTLTDLFDRLNEMGALDTASRTVLPEGKEEVVAWCVEKVDSELCSTPDVMVNISDSLTELISHGEVGSVGDRVVDEIWNVALSNISDLSIWRHYV